MTESAEKCKGRGGVSAVSRELAGHCVALRVGRDDCYVAYGGFGDGRQTDLLEACDGREPWFDADLAAEVGEDPMTLAVAWVMTNPAISCPIIGARSVEQLQSSLKAADYALGDEVMGQLIALRRIGWRRSSRGRVGQAGLVRQGCRQPGF